MFLSLLFYFGSLTCGWINYSVQSCAKLLRKAVHDQIKQSVGRSRLSTWTLTVRAVWVQRRCRRPKHLASASCFRLLSNSIACDNHVNDAALASHTPMSEMLPFQGDTLASPEVSLKWTCIALAMPGETTRTLMTIAEARCKAFTQLNIPDIGVQGYVVSPMMAQREIL